MYKLNAFAWAICVVYTSTLRDQVVYLDPVKRDRGNTFSPTNEKAYTPI